LDSFKVKPESPSQIKLLKVMKRQGLSPNFKRNKALKSTPKKSKPEVLKLFEEIIRKKKGIESQNRPVRAPCKVNACTNPTLSKPKKSDKILSLSKKFELKEMKNDDEMVNGNDEHENSDVKTHNEKPVLKSEIMVNAHGAAKVTNEKVDDLTRSTNMMMKNDEKVMMNDDYDPLYDNDALLKGKYDDCKHMKLPGIIQNNSVVKCQKGNEKLSFDEKMKLFDEKFEKCEVKIGEKLPIPKFLDSQDSPIDMSGLISVVQTGTDKPVVRLPDSKTKPKIGDGFSQKKNRY